MRKCLILCMSCNQEFFIKEEQTIFKTWGKDIIDGKYPNINIATYSSSADNKYHYNKNNHKILVPCNDDKEHTFEKTFLSFKMCNTIPELLDYDFILRTNCSTYINIKLLNNLLDILEEDILYCGEIHCNPDVYAPFKYAPYPMGSCILLSKKLISIILNSNNIKVAKQLCIKNVFNPDDTAIGAILNTYWLNQNENLLDHYQNFGLDSIYAHIENHTPLIRNLLCYSMRLYNSSYEDREKYELNSILGFHESAEYNLLDNLNFINVLIENKFFKVLSPNIPIHLNKNELIQYYQQNHVYDKLFENIKLPETQIFIYTHKDFKPIVSNNNYKILTCNKLLDSYNLQIYNTRTGENLSLIDFCYSEVEGLYWIWKKYR